MKKSSVKRAIDATGSDILTHNTEDDGSGQEVQAVVLVTDHGDRVTTYPVSGPITDAEMRASDIKVSLDGESISVTGPLTDAQLRASDVKVSLDSESVAVTGPLTDAELRATDVKVSLDGEGITVTGPLTNTELRASPLPVYGTNNVETASATVTYVGKETASGTWLVMKIDTSSGTAITYASQINNALVTTYAAAWAARAGLTFGTYSEAV